MIRYSFENLLIEIFDDTTFTAGSDNANTYLTNHFADGCQNSEGSLHGIRLHNNGIEVNSCLLIGFGGTTVHQTSALLDDSLLLICCGNTLFCLNLPDLELKWQTTVDPATCFGVFKLQHDYLVHGEIEISRIDKYGAINWSFSGADIFVTLDYTEALVLHADHIFLTDFEKNTYQIDFDGKVIWDSIWN